MVMTAIQIDHADSPCDWFVFDSVEKTFTIIFHDTEAGKDASETIEVLQISKINVKSYEPKSAGTHIDYHKAIDAAVVEAGGAAITSMARSHDHYQNSKNNAGTWSAATFAFAAMQFRNAKGIKWISKEQYKDLLLQGQVSFG